MRFVYPAVIRRVSEEKYTGYFPDLEDCVFSGDSLDDAIESAKEAEEGWIRVELEEDGDLPAISDLDDIPHAEDEILRQIAITVRLTDGWDG